MPAFIKRIGNADVAHGEAVGAFNVWPTARPAIAVERGERLKVALRIRPVTAGAGELQLISNNPDKVNYELRREAKGDGYWLDIEIGAMAEAGLHARPVILRASGESPSNLTIQLSINVPAENIIVTPKAIDLGEVSLSDLKAGLTKRSRLGVRKQVGSFRIRAISSTLPFLKLESQAIIKDSNYLIKISIDAEKLPKPGSYAGVLTVETDDGQSPLVEVPIKVRVVSSQ